MFQSSITGMISVIENSSLTLTNQRTQTNSSVDEFEYSYYTLTGTTTDQPVEMCRIANTTHVYVSATGPIALKLDSASNSAITVNGIFMADLNTSSIFLSNLLTATVTVAVVLAGNRT